MTREIYLVRHAIAAERGEQWPDDDLRPLTRAGSSRFSEVVRGLVSLGVELDVIVTSPLTRARQTAELLARGLGPKPEILLCDELSPGHEPRLVLGGLRKVGPRPRMALVGHEPDLGYLTAFLLGSRRPFSFKKGGICRIDVDGAGWSGGTLVWFAPPKLLRGLSEA